MPNTENYMKDPVGELEEILQSCLWDRVGPRIWQKERSRISIDEIGIFLYRNYGNIKPPRWIRTHGIAHLYIHNLPDRYIRFTDGFKLNLLTG